MRTTRDFRVLDVDVHIHEHPPDLAPFADPTWARAFANAAGPERWLDTFGYSPLTPLDPPIGDLAAVEPHVVRSAEQMRSDLDDRGVDAAVMFPGRFLSSAASPGDQYPVALARAYNRYLRERWLRPDRGLFGAIMVPNQDPAEGARQIEQHGGAPGVAAVYLPTAGIYPLWGNRAYDPIYAAAEAAGLPVVLHGEPTITSVFPYQVESYDTALAKQSLLHPMPAVANLVDMVTTGVFARFPRLTAVFPESGVSWLQFISWRLDLLYGDLRAEVPFLEARPSDYIRRNVYVTTHRLERPDDPAHLVACIEAIGGPGRVLFSSDWPHYDADTPERVAALPLDDGARRAILGENARAVFRLAGLGD